MSTNTIDASIMKRRFSTNTLIYAFSTAFSRSIHLFLAPMLTRLFVPADYALIAIIQSMIAFFVIFSGLNLGSGISFYYFDLEADDKRKQVISTGLVAFVVFATFVCFIIIENAEHINEFIFSHTDSSESIGNLINYIKVSAFSLLFSLLMTATQSILRLQGRAKSYFVVESSSFLTQLLLVCFFLFYLKLGLLSVFLAAALSQFVGMMIGLYLLRHFIAMRFSFSIFLLIATYALPQLPAVFINWGQTQLGRFFLTHFVSMNEVGLYSIAFTFATILMLAVTSFRLAYDPFALSIMKEKNARFIYANFFRYYTSVFLLIFVALTLLSAPFFHVFTAKTYSQAYLLTPFLLMSGFYMGLNNILATGIWISKKLKYTSYAQFASFFAMLLLSYYLIPAYGAKGAAITYLLSTIVQSLSFYYFAQRNWPIPYPFWRTQAFTFFIFSISELTNILSMKVSILSQLIIKFSVFCLTVFLVFYFFLNASEKLKLISTMRKYARIGLEGV